MKLQSYRIMLFVLIGALFLSVSFVYAETLEEHYKSGIAHDVMTGKVPKQKGSSASWLTGISVVKSNPSEGNFFYALFDSSSSISCIVFPGDQILFRGSGIKAGYVEGEALNKEHGAWKLVKSQPGIIIFEATTKCKFIKEQPLGNFVLIGKYKSHDKYYRDYSELINYRVYGEWIGSFGEVFGPISTDPDAK